MNGENQEQNNMIENNSKFTLKDMEKENGHCKENRGQMRRMRWGGGGGMVDLLEITWQTHVPV